MNCGTTKSASATKWARNENVVVSTARSYPSTIEAASWTDAKAKAMPGLCWPFGRSPVGAFDPMYHGKDEHGGTKSGCC